MMHIMRAPLAYGDRGVKAAMRAADRSGARLALVVGDRDIEAGTVGVKNLSTVEQVDAAVDSVVAEVLSRLTYQQPERVCTTKRRCCGASAHARGKA
jgi:histidyl-tRNA synthetase